MHCQSEMPGIIINEVGRQRFRRTLNLRKMPNKRKRGQTRVLGFEQRLRQKLSKRAGSMAGKRLRHGSNKARRRV